MMAGGHHRIAREMAASYEGVSDSSIETTEVLTVPTAFAVRKSGKLANATSLADLCEAEWIHSDTSNAYPQFIATLFGQHGLPVSRRITRCTSQSLLYSLAISLDTVMAWASHTARTGECERTVPEARLHRNIAACQAAINATRRRDPDAPRRVFHSLHRGRERDIRASGVMDALRAMRIFMAITPHSAWSKQRAAHPAR
jgi:hypothetical protein